MAKVDVAVACSAGQSHLWWSKVMAELLYEQNLGVEIGTILASSAALPDHNKTHNVDKRPYASIEEKGRNKLTDANRLNITRSFLEGDSEWLWFLDDDTVPPPGALTQLLSHARSFVAGTYFLNRPPYGPVAYIRRTDGLYSSLEGYAKGTFTEVDSVGMGCTLIHRGVFEIIEENHVVYQRPNGALVAIHKRLIKDELHQGFLFEQLDDGDLLEWVEDGILHTRVQNVPIERENRPFPFFVLEYGRTEDHHFCELAANVNIRPWLDTSIVCKHVKEEATGNEKYLENFIRMLRDGDAYIEPS